MAALVLHGTRSPLAQTPAFAGAPDDLRAVLAAQAVEAHSLRARLMEGQRECAQLRLRLRDSSEEVSAAAEAVSTAAGRLEAHAGRHGLVLAAGVERCSAERAALEDELQRMEHLLWERDQELRTLQMQTRELDAMRLQGELELAGLVATHEATTSEIHALGAGVHELSQRVGTEVSKSPPGPTQAQLVRAEATAATVKFKRDEHAALLRQAEAMASEARRLEGEKEAFEEHVRSFERSLRHKQGQMELQDQHLVRDAAALRGQCEHLRHALRDEQRDAVGVDQRAVLHTRCGEEAESVRREIERTLGALRGLVMSLRGRGRFVRSPEVPQDSLDTALHAQLRHVDPAVVPPLLWRLGHGEYLIGEDRVHLHEAHGVLMATSGASHHEHSLPLDELLHHQARRAITADRAFDT